MPLSSRNPRRSGKSRPFRGLTPAGVFQTVDIGSGMHPSSFIFRRAERNPRRSYVATDRVLPEIAPANVRRELAPIQTFLNEMIEKGWKTRHINMDMPFPLMAITLAPLLFRAMPRVLLPNGKVYVTTENLDDLEILKDQAKKNGFTARIMKDLSPRAAASRTQFTRSLSSLMEGNTYPIHRMEITYPLKRAHPTKVERQGLNMKKRGA